ncbi:MAG: hypothetical protein AB8B49_04755 [Nitratireductor sp.]
MGQLIKLNTLKQKRNAAKCLTMPDDKNASAQILFFTGVRYERTHDGEQSKASTKKMSLKKVAKKIRS